MAKLVQLPSKTLKLASTLVRQSKSMTIPKNSKPMGTNSDVYDLFV